MVFRVEKTQNYTVMSNYHLREKNMSLKAKGLLCWMLSNTDDWDYSMQGIIANCKENETAIRSTLKELQDFGYLEIKKLMPESKVDESGNKQAIRSHIEYEYIIHEQPLESQGIENLYIEKQVQRNTKTSNTNKENKKSNIINNITTDFEFGVKKQPKQNLYSKCVNLIAAYTDNSKLHDVLLDYLKMRLEIKDKPLYINSWKGLLNKLFRDFVEQDRLDVVYQSIERGYASFYPVNKSSKKQPSTIDLSLEGDSTQDTEEERIAHQKWLKEMEAKGEQTVF